MIGWSGTDWPSVTAAMALAQTLACWLAMWPDPGVPGALAMAMASPRMRMRGCTVDS